MTVIVIRDGIIAADRLISYEGVKFAPACKLTVGETERYWFAGGLAGTAQSAKLEHKLMVDTLDTFEPQKLPGSYALVMLARHKQTHSLTLFNADQDAQGELSSMTYTAGEDWPEYFAIGSGAEMALGALAHGASAVQAVLAVNKHSQKCGEGYNWAAFDEPRNGFKIRRW